MALRLIATTLRDVDQLDLPSGLRAIASELEQFA
jgi:hypothetical protein